ncbi:AAA family ATPase [uncultured Vibrio sp.]|uniref:AAA family ATPase n=1 Tax=uncultured Vibrio sp. TaxID=114054 RepID=UPI0025D7551C|nr:AAA family ATPase [uncultured Vibrio sp.]
MSDELQKYSKLINRIRIPSFSNEGFKSNISYASPGVSEEIDWNWQLENLRPINLFIGPNNSGKSRLLRHIYISDLSTIDSDDLPIRGIIDLLINPDLANNLAPEFSHYGYNAKLAETVQKSILGKMVKETKYNTVHRLISSTTNDRVTSVRSQIRDKLTPKFIEHLFSPISAELLKHLSSYNDKNFKKTYIPLLRGLRTLSKSDVYLDRTLKDYFADRNATVNMGANYENKLGIFTGHSLYKDLTVALLGNHQQRQSVKDYEAFLSKQFFENEEIALVPRLDSESNSDTESDNDVVYMKIGDRKERPIFDLGDGIQTVIMLTVQAFLNEDATMFFIEEPEQNVHAGLQRAIIEAFRLRPQHMYFMTTHSNHFIDMAQEYDDVSLQRVHQELVESDGNEDKKEVTVVESSESSMAVLQSLGVRASSVLTANCSIWVEGITDKLYLRTYLAKFIKELELSNKPRAEKLKRYQENLHYIFTEYQGSNITHWAFNDDVDADSTQTPAKKLSQNILLIADGDIRTSGDRVENLESDLASNFYLLDWKEIENYIPKDLIVKTAEKRWETFNSEKNDYNIIFENIVIKANFEDKKKGIGEILEHYVKRKKGAVGKGTPQRKFYSAPNGSIKDKVKFCETAIEVMNSDKEWKLTKDLNKLCEKIWSHIEEHNK